MENTRRKFKVTNLVEEQSGKAASLRLQPISGPSDIVVDLHITGAEALASFTEGAEWWLELTPATDKAGRAAG